MEHDQKPQTGNQNAPQEQTKGGERTVNRRSLVMGTAAITAAVVTSGHIAQASSDRSVEVAAVVSAQSGDAFSLVETSVAQIQAALANRQVSVRALVQACLDRIAENDQEGPALHAVIEINPDALTIADQLDAELASDQSRGPLHGLPILLKDNIATVDQMQTTAGSLALVGAIPTHDSFVAAQVRDAGMVILGKANLSEWANIRSVWSSSGWSGRGGQTVNPYQLDRTPSGSSSGSAVAVAASYVPLAIGTETNGSLVSPAGNCGVVAIKPTVGLVSRQGVIPISHNQDTVGPMARSVADAAALLNVLAVIDPEDPANKPPLMTIAGAASTPTASPAAGASLIATPTYPVRPDEAKKPIDYTDPAILGADGLRGARIGVLRASMGFSVGADEVFERALKSIQELGAELIDPVEMPSLAELKSSKDGLDVMLWELKADLPAYIEGFVAPSFPVRTLADVIAFNQAHADAELQWFGQDLFLAAQAKGDLNDPEYTATVLRNQQRGRQDGIDAVLQKYDLDAIVAPTNGPATRVDLVNGDHWLGGTSTAAAAAGYPLVTVPAGSIFGLPVGVTFMGGAFSEPTLIRCAYAFEQHTMARTAPTYTPAGVLPPVEPSVAQPAATPQASPQATPAAN